MLYLPKIVIVGTKDKLINRFKTIPKDFTWDEVCRMLTFLGYSLRNKGKTSGSRVIFLCDGRKPLMLHNPHPGNIVKEYVLTLASSVLNRDEKYKKYSVIKDENEKPLYVLNSETGKKIYFKDIKMNLNFTRIDL